MLHGAVPYVDVWDRKQIGLFLVYLPAAAFGPSWGIYAYQALALASVVATAAMIARLAERVGWARGAPWAAVAYVVWLDIADGQGGQTPVFYTTLTTGAVLLAGGVGSADRGTRRGHAAMALVGLALQIKYSVMFEGAWIGLWLLWRARAAGARSGALLAHAIGLAGVALVPTIAVAAWFGLNGHWDAFVFANFVSIALRHGDPWTITLGKFLGLSAMLAPLVVMAGIGRGRPTASSGQERQRVLLYGWLAAALTGLTVFGAYFDHYALPAMAPAACCAAGFAARGRRSRIAAWAIVAAAVATGQFLVLHQRARRGTPAEFRRIVADTGSGPGCLFVYSGEPMLYPASGRCTLTRFLFPSHLDSEREQGAIGVDQAAEVNRVLDLRPAVVVVASAYPGARMDLRARVLARLAQGGYRLAAHDPLGDGTVDVYRRRAH